MPRYRLEILLALGFVACAEPAVEHTEHRVTSRESTSADARPSAAETGAELGDIVGYQCPNAPTSLLYGEKTIKVSAKSYWTSTGLYLRAGESAHLTSTGTWTIWAGKTPPFDADGGATLSSVDGCAKGALVAKVGLSLGTEKICVGKEGDVTAEESGIVYLAMNDSASPAFHDGWVEVAISAASDTAPSLSLSAATSYDFCSLASGWAEVETEQGLLLTLPASLAASQQDTMTESLAKLDDMYTRASELLGEAPFAGEALRLYPDFAVRSRGWIVAGNPLLYDPKNLNGVTPSAMKVLDLAAPGSKLFDFARAIGVDVSRAKGGRYQPDENAAEAWGGLVAAYVAEEVPLGPWPREACLDEDEHARSGSFDGFVADPWLQLCLLTTLKDQYGWELFARYFAALPNDWTGILPQTPTAREAWQFVYQRLTIAAGADLSATFSRFKVITP